MGRYPPTAKRDGVTVTRQTLMLKPCRFGAVMEVAKLQSIVYETLLL
jgi:hypothetical protein